MDFYSLLLCVAAGVGGWFVRHYHLLPLAQNSGGVFLPDALLQGLRAKLEEKFPGAGAALDEILKDLQVPKTP